MKVIRFLLIVTLIAGGAYCARDVLLRSVIESLVEQATGVQIDIATFRTKFREQAVFMSGITVHDPAGFDEPQMAQLNRIYAKFDLRGLRQRVLTIERLVIDIEELTVVKNASGTVNLTALKGVRQGSAGADVPGPIRRHFSFSIDTLDFKIDNVAYIDYTSRPRPYTARYPLNVSVRLRGVADIRSVVHAIVVEAISKAGIADLLDLNLRFLQKELLRNVKEGVSVLERGFSVPWATGEKTLSDVGGFFATMGERFKQGVQNIGGALQRAAGNGTERE